MKGKVFNAQEVEKEDEFRKQYLQLPLENEFNGLSDWQLRYMRKHSSNQDFTKKINQELHHRQDLECKAGRCDCLRCNINK